MKSYDSGIYFLLIFLNEQRFIHVGALGELYFQKGYYGYIGSAQRNMRKRIERHFRKEKRKRWHIDYFLEFATIEDYITCPLPKYCEERIAMSLEKKYQFVKNFGASDSRAKSHLFFGEKENLWNDVIHLFERCREND